MNRTFLIRRLQKSDLKAYRALRLKALKTDSEAFVDTYQEEKRTSSLLIKKRIEENIILGAIFNSKLIGILAFSRDEKSKFQHVGHLGSMYIDPKYRKLHIGRQLLQAMLGWLGRMKGLYAVQLKVITLNVPAIRLYESAGFRCWGREEKALFHEGQYFDQLHYRLILHPEEKLTKVCRQDTIFSFLKIRAETEA